MYQLYLIQNHLHTRARTVQSVSIHAQPDICIHDIQRVQSPEIFMKTAQQHVAEILSASVVYVPSDDAAATHRILVQVALYARCLEEKVSSLLRSTPTSNTSLSPISMAPGPEMVLADVSADALSIRDPLSSLVSSSSQKNIRFYGESSSVQFIRATMKYLNGNTRVYATQRSEFWTIQPVSFLTFFYSFSR